MSDKKEREEEVVDLAPTTREVLEAEQSDLLALLDRLETLGLRDTSAIEQRLSVVNRDIAAL